VPVIRNFMCVLYRIAPGVKVPVIKRKVELIVDNAIKCHDYGYNYSAEIKSTASPTSIKRQALQLYLEGLGFRSIGRFLGVSHVSVQKWIRKLGVNSRI
jgi:transposase-like protein